MDWAFWFRSLSTPEAQFVYYQVLCIHTYYIVYIWIERQHYCIMLNQEGRIYWIQLNQEDKFILSQWEQSSAYKYWVEKAIFLLTLSAIFCTRQHPQMNLRKALPSLWALVWGLGPWRAHANTTHPLRTSFTRLFLLPTFLPYFLDAQNGSWCLFLFGGGLVWFFWGSVSL